MDEEQKPIKQVRIVDRETVAGVKVDDIIKFRDKMQEALDEFEEETGWRVAITAIDWAGHESEAMREETLEQSLD